LGALQQPGTFRESRAILELVKETYGTSDPVWDDDGVTAVVAMEGIGEEEPSFEDLAELLCESFDAGDAVDDDHRR
jgi:hypothetical protein